jgi:hypothetical protein
MITKDNDLIDVQYKILHNFYPTIALVSKWSEDVSEKCQICKANIDDIMHYVYRSETVENFWKTFAIWWKNIEDVNLNLTEKEMIFGILNPFNDQMFHCLNLCILLAKYHISVQKKNKNNPCFYVFLQELKMRIESEKLCTMKNNKIINLKKYRMEYMMNYKS